MAQVDEPPKHTARAEHHFHQYTGNRIPWYVRLIWLLFWIFAVYYFVVYLVPIMQVEMISPP